MIHWASKIAMTAKLTEIHDETLKFAKQEESFGPVGLAPNYKGKIACGVCYSYRH